MGHGGATTPGSKPSEATIDATVFEVERFEWTSDDRIELTGVWSGLRGSRFMRPTLVLTVGGERRRLLALLDHKPWSADEGDDWIAAFAWKGEPAEVERAELSVASGIDLELPPPRRATGKKPARRFKHRAVAREGSGPEAAEAEVTEQAAASPPKKAAPKEANPGPDAVSPEERLAAALARATAAETRVRELEKERDDAIARRKAISAELTAATEAHLDAVRRARAEERENATTLLAEGAELRASVERQREMAYTARDEAQAERDEAIAAKEQALHERREAMSDRKEAFRERDQAFVERDHAMRERDRALDARDAALQERERANDERDTALNERDTIVSVHKRGLPVVPPQPRHLPAEPERSELEVWGPRAAAAGAIAVFLVIVLRLVAGL
jgi:hypothetical protein